MEFVERRVEDSDRASFDFRGLTCARLMGRVVEPFSWIVNSDRSVALIPLGAGFPEDFDIILYKFVVSGARIDVAVRKIVTSLSAKSGNSPDSKAYLIKWGLVDFDFYSSIEGEREKFLEVLKQALCAVGPFGFLLSQDLRFRTIFDF